MLKNLRDHVDPRYFIPMYWLWRWQRFCTRPKVGYACRVHGVDPVVVVTGIEYGSDVHLSDGRREDWYHCCERVMNP